MDTLHADDLMLGNWLLDSKGNPTRVMKISEGYPQYFACGKLMSWWSWFKSGCPSRKLLYSWEEKFTPVPLTKEILEKNGLTQEKYLDGEYRLNKKYWLVHSMRYNDKDPNGTFFIAVQKEHPFDDGFVIHTFVTIKYVHELQNILKACGIYKDINL